MFSSSRPCHSPACIPLATDAFEPIWGVRFKPAQPVPSEWVARDRERKIPLGELWQEITGRAEGYRPLPPARLEIARDD